MDIPNFRSSSSNQWLEHGRLDILSFSYVNLFLVICVFYETESFFAMS